MENSNLKANIRQMRKSVISSPDASSLRKNYTNSEGSGTKKRMSVFDKLKSSAQSRTSITANNMNIDQTQSMNIDGYNRSSIALSKSKASNIRKLPPPPPPAYQTPQCDSTPDLNVMNRPTWAHDDRSTYSVSSNGSSSLNSNGKLKSSNDIGKNFRKSVMFAENIESVQRFEADTAASSTKYMNDSNDTNKGINKGITDSNSSATFNMNMSMDTFHEEDEEFSIHDHDGGSIGTTSTDNTDILSGNNNNDNNNNHQPLVSPMQSRMQHRISFMALRDKASQPVSLKLSAAQGNNDQSDNNDNNDNNKGRNRDNASGDSHHDNDTFDNGTQQSIPFANSDMAQSPIGNNNNSSSNSNSNRRDSFGLQHPDAVHYGLQPATTPTPTKNNNSSSSSSGNGNGQSDDKRANAAMRLLKRASVNLDDYYEAHESSAGRREIEGGRSFPDASSNDDLNSGGNGNSDGSTAEFRASLHQDPTDIADINNIKGGSRPSLRGDGQSVVNHEHSNANGGFSKLRDMIRTYSNRDEEVGSSDSDNSGIPADLPVAPPSVPPLEPPSPQPSSGYLKRVESTKPFDTKFTAKASTVNQPQGHHEESEDEVGVGTIGGLEKLKNTLIQVAAPVDVNINLNDAYDASGGNVEEDDVNDTDYEEEYTHIPVAHKISHRNSGIFGMRRLGQSIVETWEQQTLSKDETNDNKNDNGSNSDGIQDEDKYLVKSTYHESSDNNSVRSFGKLASMARNNRRKSVELSHLKMTHGEATLEDLAGEIADADAYEIHPNQTANQTANRTAYRNIRGRPTTTEAGLQRQAILQEMNKNKNSDDSRYKNNNALNDNDNDNDHRSDIVRIEGDSNVNGNALDGANVSAASKRNSTYSSKEFLELDSVGGNDNASELTTDMLDTTNTPINHSSSDVPEATDTTVDSNNSVDNENSNSSTLNPTTSGFLSKNKSLSNFRNNNLRRRSQESDSYNDKYNYNYNSNAHIHEEGVSPTVADSRNNFDYSPVKKMGSVRTFVGSESDDDDDDNNDDEVYLEDEDEAPLVEYNLNKNRLDIHNNNKYYSNSNRSSPVSSGYSSGGSPSRMKSNKPFTSHDNDNYVNNYINNTTTVTAANTTNNENLKANLLVANEELKNRQRHLLVAQEDHMESTLSAEKDAMERIYRVEKLAMRKIKNEEEKMKTRIEMERSKVLKELKEEREALVSERKEQETLWIKERSELASVAVALLNKHKELFNERKHLARVRSLVEVNLRDLNKWNHGRSESSAQYNYNNNH